MPTPTSAGNDQWPPFCGIVLPQPVVSVNAGLVVFKPSVPFAFSGVAPVAALAVAE